MIDYIIACYFGPRRVKTNSPAHNNRFFYISQHIDKLNSHKDKNISRVIFIVNRYNNQDNELELYTPKLRIPYEIIYRPQNISFSYGCWNEGIIHRIKNKTNASYFMIMEDDYAPCINNFSSYFLQKIKPNIAAVFQYYGKVGHRHPMHPAISNGIITKESCLEVYKYQNSNSIFHLTNGTSYNEAVADQVYFMLYFQQLGYDIADIQDIAKNRFQNGGFDHQSVKILGNPFGVDVICPIL